MAKRTKRDPIAAMENSSFVNYRSELDVFTSPKETDPIAGYKDVNHAPFSSLSNDGPITFSVSASDSMWTDLSQTTLALVVSVSKEGGGELPPLPSSGESTDREEVTVANDFFDCLFSRVGLWINSTFVGSPHRHHPQVSVIRHLLSYPSEVAQANLQHSIIWKPDRGERLREVMYNSRYQFIDGSKDICLSGRLSHDVFNSGRLLPPGNRIEIKLERNGPEFPLITYGSRGQKTYKVNWKQATLTLRRVKTTQNTSTHLCRQLPLKTVFLPFYRTDARCFQVPKGSTQWRAQNIYTGVLPQRALLVLIHPDSTGNGRFGNNPVIFPASKYKLSFVQFYIDEIAVLPKPYEPKWDTEQYLHSYQGLLRTLGLEHSLNTSGIDYDMYGEDYSIFGVSLKGVNDSGSGNLSLDLNFETALSEPVTGMIICEYNACLTIDPSGNVLQSDYV